MVSAIHSTNNKGKTYRVVVADCNGWEHQRGTCQNIYSGGCWIAQIGGQRGDEMHEEKTCHQQHQYQPQDPVNIFHGSPYQSLNMPQLFTYKNTDNLMFKN